MSRSFAIPSPELPWATPGGPRGGPRRPESLAEAARGAFEGPKSTEEVARGVRGDALDRFWADLGSIWGGPKCLAHRQGRVAEHFRRNSLFPPSRAPRARFCASQTRFRRLFDPPWALFGRPWSLLRRPCGARGGFLGLFGRRFGRFLGLSGALWGALGPPDGSLGALGTVLGSI